MAFQGYNIADKIRIGYDTVTNEIGLQFKVVNAENVVKGEVLSCSTSVDNKYIKQANEFDSVLIAYEAANADAGVWAWKIGASRCQVLFKNTISSTRGYVCIAADTDGRADNIAVPSASPAASEHFKEIGHVCESKTTATDLLVMIDTHAL